MPNNTKQITRVRGRIKSLRADFCGVGQYRTLNMPLHGSQRVCAHRFSVFSCGSPGGVIGLGTDEGCLRGLKQSFCYNVRRQNIWDDFRRDRKEDLAHLLSDVKRLGCDGEDVDSEWSV